MKLPDFKIYWIQYLRLFAILWFIFLRYLYPSDFVYSDNLFLLLLIIPLLHPIRSMMAGKEDMISFLELRVNKDGSYSYGIGTMLNLLSIIILAIVSSNVGYTSQWLAPSLLLLFLIFFILTAISKGTSLSKEVFFGKLRPKSWLTIYVVLVTSLYTYSGIFGANVYFDFSKPQIFQVKVVDKRNVTGGLPRQTGSIYYIKLAPWGSQNHETEIKVSKNTYERLVIGQFANVQSKIGLFSAPWYFVEY